MSTINEEPPAKRQNRSLGASDRITVDVGGTKFITSVSTLTSNSTYFASLLSGNWSESGDNEIFLDRNPSAFSTLIEYMREGMIKVDDIDESVLTLAEFLGVERLLLAVKIRWYHNIGKGPVHSTDEEIAAAFDQRYGGIMKAMAAGLFPHFLKQDDVHAERDFAIMRIEDDPDNRVKVKEVGKPIPEQRASSNIGGLNGLHRKGYTKYEKQLRTKSTYTFSRRKHFLLKSEATDIFIPNDEEVGSGYTKQFAVVISEFGGPNRRLILAPSEFDQDESKRSDIFWHAPIYGTDPWLEDHGFTTHEEEYEEILGIHDENTTVKGKIFSRLVERENGDRYLGAS